MTPLALISNVASDVLSREYVNESPSPSFAVTVATVVPPTGCFPGMSTELGGEEKIGAALPAVFVVPLPLARPRARTFSHSSR